MTPREKAVVALIWTCIAMAPVLLILFPLLGVADISESDNALTAMLAAAVGAHGATAWEKRPAK